MLLKTKTLHPKNYHVVVELGLLAIRHRLPFPELAECRKIALQHRGDLKGILFVKRASDADWFCKKYSGLIGSMVPLAHYIHYGNVLALNPNSNFDSVYYALTYSDLFDL